MEKEQIRLKCQNCDYVWVYTGTSHHYATCPRCLYKVQVVKRRV